MSGLSINTNLNALKANRSIKEASGSLQERIEAISSALQINEASDDAAGVAISEGLSSQIRGSSQALQNTQDGISMAQTAEGGAEVITESLQRIRELSIQSANDTLTDSDREAVNSEIEQLTEEIDRVTETVEFNGKQLLNGDLSDGADIQAGANRDETVEISVDAQDSATLGVDGADASTQENAEQTIEDTTAAINQVATDRADLGAQQNRLENTADFLQVQEENQQASESRIRDADLAAETTEQAQNQIQLNAATGTLSQVNNLQGSNALQLLG